MSGASGSAGAGPGAILFLDDEPDIVEAFGIALDMMGINGIGFTQPEKALERLAADPGGIRAIITDYTMPQMPCTEFIRRARALRPDIPIHLCTGNAQHEIQEVIRELGIRSVLYKPFEYSALETFMSGLSEGGP